MGGQYVNHILFPGLRFNYNLQHRPQVESSHQHKLCCSYYTAYNEATPEQRLIFTQVPFTKKENKSIGTLDAWLINYETR